MNPFKQVKGGICAPRGFKAAGVTCGLKASGKKDLMLLFSEAPAAAAAVFTTNAAPAAPVVFNQEQLKKNKYFRAVAVNSGNANACTGKQGYKNALKTAALAAKNLKIEPVEVLLGSTGIIGHQLKMELLEKGIEEAAGKVTPGAGADAAEAIMTTDTFPKETAVSFTLAGKQIFVGGIAKGAGMICPDMATMLAFVTTDAKVSPGVLQKLTGEAAGATFNAITIDGDMSTNDQVLVLANGLAGNKEIKTLQEAALLKEAFSAVMSELAEMIVRDGEGATKFIKITVTGAKSKEDAAAIGKKIANSLLVKTAFFGNDLNWGRILCAACAAGVPLDPEKIDIFLGGLRIVKGGQAADFDAKKAQKLIKAKDIELSIHLYQGKAEAVTLTTDLSFDYVKINSLYTT